MDRDVVKLGVRGHGKEAGVKESRAWRESKRTDKTVPGTELMKLL